MDIIIPLFPGFTALDAIGPYEVLSRLPGATIKFAARVTGEIRSDVGSLGVSADFAFSEIDRADILVVPGGPGARDLIGDDAMNEWVRAIDRTTTWTTSVCTGSLVLASAGLLDGQPATTHWSAFETLAELGAKPVSERVVFAGKRVTSAGVSAGIDMALGLAAKATSDDIARVIQLGIEYDPDPPFKSGSLATAPEPIIAIARAALR